MKKNFMINWDTHDILEVDEYTKDVDFQADCLYESCLAKNKDLECGAYQILDDLLESKGLNCVDVFLMTKEEKKDYLNDFHEACKKAVEEEFNCEIVSLDF